MSPSPPHAAENEQARLFGRALLVSLATSALFYVIAYLQPEPHRAVSIVRMALLFDVTLILAIWRLRAGNLTFAVHLVCLMSCGILTAGILNAGRTGPTVWFYIAGLLLSIFHSDPRQIIITLALYVASALLIWPLVTLTDPVQMPSFLVILLLAGSIAYLNARAHQRNVRSLQRAQALAEKANASKTRFLGVMSHELRTPLNAIIGYAALMREDIADDMLDPQDAAQDLERISQAGHHLLQLVSGLLTLVDSEDADFEPALATMDATTLFAELEDATRYAATQSAQSALTFEVHAPPLTFSSDPEHLEQILLALILNALRFARGCAVHVSAAREGDRVIFVVSDNGPGIAAEAQELIFEPFTQLDSSSTREVDGAGIGLALARRITQRLGGTLTLESAPAQGARFTVSLPAS